MTLRGCCLAVGAAALLSGCASMADGAQAAAPQPAKPVDAARFYSGVWHEIARNPMSITNGCVAGITEFQHDEKGQLIDRDSCRKGDPVTGEEKVFAGPAVIDPTNSAKFTTHYKVVGPFGPSRTYWVLDHGEGWFIVATPDFKNASIFTRNPQAPKPEVDRLVARLGQLGFDPAKLEFPAQPPR